MKLNLNVYLTYATVAFCSFFVAYLLAKPQTQTGCNQSALSATLKPRIADPYTPSQNSYVFPAIPANGLGTGP